MAPLDGRDRVELDAREAPHRVLDLGGRTRPVPGRISLRGDREAAHGCQGDARGRHAPVLHAGTTTDRPVTLPAMRRFVLVCLVVLAAAYAVGVPLFLLSDDDALPEGADAVVVLSGPDNLLPAGQTLVGGGIAPTLVVSASRRGRGDRRVQFCRSEPEDVECVYPGPFSTPGEAQAISALAERRGWDTVVLVTSDYERLVAERVFRAAVTSGSPSTASTSRGGATWSGFRSSG